MNEPEPNDRVGEVPDRLNAAEAVMGFAAWLTSQDQPITMSGHHNASPACEAVALFLETNGFGQTEIRDNYHKILKHPTGPIKYADAPVTNQNNMEEQKQSNLASMREGFVMANTLTFGEALEALKHGSLAARTGWNGKGMFIFMRPSDELSAEFIINTVKSLPKSIKDHYVGQFAHNAKEEAEGKGPADVKVKFTAYLCMKAADGTIVNGWLASQTDMLAEDWEIIRP